MSKNEAGRMTRKPKPNKASRTPSAKHSVGGQKTNGATTITQLKSPQGLHKRNVHQGRYDFERLVKALPELKQHVVKNPVGEATIRFDDPIAVKLLNKALLAEHYGVTHWDIPQGYLCPPIPGRADYIHRLADFIVSEAPKLNHQLVKALDIGVGANCIYPIVGATQYGWQYVGSDVDVVSVENANGIAAENRVLKDKVECRLQADSGHFFQGIIQPGEYYDVTTCNPPFHSSLEDAQKGTERKLANLKAHKAKRGLINAEKAKNTTAKIPALNFGGQKAELWCLGGEAAFVKNLASESKEFAAQVLWFSTLISKKENVQGLCQQLENVGAKQVTIVDMSQGQKISRFVAWSFKDKAQRQAWLALKSR